MSNGLSFDVLSLKDMAAKAGKAGIAKVQLGTYRMFALAILAGAFIG